MSKTVKKVLFLMTSKRDDQSISADRSYLRKMVTKNLGPDYKVSVGFFSDLVYLADGDNSKIWNINEGWDIADFDLVVIKLVKDDQNLAIASAHYLNGRGVPFADEYLLTEANSKLVGSFLRFSKDLKGPKTLYASPQNLLNFYKTNPIFGYPFIFKADNSHKGKNNYLINSYSELQDRANESEGKLMIAQEFIPNDGDMRILVLGGKPRLAIFRKAVKGSHLNNTSMGASAELIDLHKLNKNILRDSVKAAKLDKLQVAGVDLMIDKNTGKHYIIEVNRAPQLATGSFVDEKLVAYGDMVRDMVEYNAKHPVTPSRLSHIGRVERVSLPEINNKKFAAKIDTGAESSSIHATDIKVENGILFANIFGKTLEFGPSSYSLIRIENSFGQKETRYKVKMSVKINGRLIKGTFSLANRENKIYKVLIGRRLIAGKFIVDVQSGRPLIKKERLHSKSLQAELKNNRI